MFAKSRIFLFKLTLKLFPFAGKTEKNETNIQNETDSKKKKKKKIIRNISLCRVSIIHEHDALARNQDWTFWLQNVKWIFLTTSYLY